MSDNSKQEKLENLTDKRNQDSSVGVLSILAGAAAVGVGSVFSLPLVAGAGVVACGYGAYRGLVALPKKEKEMTALAAEIEADVVARDLENGLGDVARAVDIDPDQEATFDGALDRDGADLVVGQR